MNSILAYPFTVASFAQIFSMLVHVMVIWVGVILVRGYYKVFRSHPSNIAFAMVMLLSSMVTTSVILGANAIAWFVQMCIFCELNSHYLWVQILWTGVYSIGFIMLYLIIKRKIDL